MENWLKPKIGIGGLTFVLFILGQLEFHRSLRNIQTADPLNSTFFPHQPSAGIGGPHSSHLGSSHNAHTLHGLRTEHILSMQCYGMRICLNSCKKCRNIVYRLIAWTLDVSQPCGASCGILGYKQVSYDSYKHMIICHNMSNSDLALCVGSGRMED